MALKSDPWNLRAFKGFKDAYELWILAQVENLFATFYALENLFAIQIGAYFTRCLYSDSPYQLIKIRHNSKIYRDATHQNI